MSITITAPTKESKSTEVAVVKKATARGPAEPTFIQKVIKGKTYLVMAQSAVELEDEFSSLYYTAQNQSNIFLMPPFDPQELKNLVNTNNVLGQCIEAMEINIDGTGYKFVGVDDDTKIDPKEEQQAKAFFDQPYPGISFVSMRRKLRRERESVGYAYLEVLRNVAGDIVALRNIETHNVRMVKLDAPVQVKRKVMRGGQEVELVLWERERRFAQRVALKQLVYYREYGTTRKVSRTTGEWETPENPVAPDDLGTELIIFGVHPDVTTPYFLPRWINQLPSVIGSRAAEEQNLEFLDSGGMPPALIFIQGGTLAKNASDQLKQYLSGANKNKHRAVVVEAMSSSGSLESAGSVQVKVERFGSDRAMDAMYLKYDNATEEHVRVGFRIPPLFLGKASDYNFATAQTAYMVAEEQVFKPERMDFDEVLNMTIMQEFGYKTIKFQSLPMVMKDMATTIQALTIAQSMSTPDSFIAEINNITGLDLEMEEPTDPLVAAQAQAIASGNANPDGSPIEPAKKPQTVPPAKGVDSKSNYVAAGEDNPQATTKTAGELMALAQDYASIKGLTKKREFSAATEQRILEEVKALKGTQAKMFDGLIAAFTFGSTSPDLVHLAGCAHKH